MQMSAIQSSDNLKSKLSQNNFFNKHVLNSKRKKLWKRSILAFKEMRLRTKGENQNLNNYP